MRLCILLLLVLAHSSQPDADQVDETVRAIEISGEAADDRRIHPGMTASEVQKRLGEPGRVARQIMYRRYREQWIYDNRAGLRIDFDCLKGQDPHVLTVRAPTPQ